jgi:lipoprotein-anchoring transpeptidase ErfK/SrfK
MVRTERPSSRFGAFFGASRIDSDRPPTENSHLRGSLRIAGAVVIAALCAAAYTTWSGHRTGNEAANVAPDRASTTHKATKDGDLPPGIDGYSEDVNQSQVLQSYVLRRQPTFYRTLQPVGTIIIDKSQRFLYLVQPNNVALRYAIGIGRQCTELVGLRHVARMAEWPAWEAPSEMVKQKLASPGLLSGGPGNPLGARVLELDDNASRINGTNAPNTIGTTVAFGCIRLANDDIIDLYGRVAVGASVVVN